MNSKLFDAKGIAEIKNIPPETVKRLYRERKIPGFVLGHRTLRFDLAKVEAALERLEVKAVK